MKYIFTTHNNNIILKSIIKSIHAVSLCFFPHTLLPDIRVLRELLHLPVPDDKLQVRVVWVVHRELCSWQLATFTATTTASVIAEEDDVDYKCRKEYDSKVNKNSRKSEVIQKQKHQYEKK